jgi:short-subunit dehydrogenase
MLRSDVTDDAAVNAVVSTVLSKTGRIVVLVNNPVLGCWGRAEKSSVAQVQALFDVNLFGVMRMNLWTTRSAPLTSASRSLSRPTPAASSNRTRSIQIRC